MFNTEYGIMIFTNKTQAAKLLGVGRKRIYTMIKEGKIVKIELATKKSVRSVYIHRDQMLKFLMERL